MNRKIIRDDVEPQITPDSIFSKSGLSSNTLRLSNDTYSANSLAKADLLAKADSLAKANSLAKADLLAKADSSKILSRDRSSRSYSQRPRELASPQSRLIAFIIDVAIFTFGFGVVWLFWFVTLAQRGTTPGHYLMGQVVIDSTTGKPLGWKKMVIREVLIKGILQWFLGGFLFLANYIIDASFIFTAKARTLHDLMVGSQVIQISDKTIIKKLKSNEVDDWLNK